MSILDEADRKLTDNECAGARGRLPRGQGSQEPSSAALANHGIAEEYEAIQSKPNDFDALLAATAAELEALRQFEAGA
ncbi:hypothetical protein D7Y21_12805 [Corallococcus sp. AB045]|nr:hypothetical protein D7Y21_12805 [Corallococcus sp. AB045]